MKLPAITAVLAQYRNTSDGLVTPGMMEAAWAELHDAERLMPADVSRVEYDAALKRVQAKGECPDRDECAAASSPDPDCACRRATLAALGLDEPPTEEDAVTPGPAPEIVMDANGHYWRRYDDSLSMVPTTTANEETEVVAVYQRVDPDAPWPSTHAQHGVLLDQIKELHAELESLRPPTEPPKACPTCEGRSWKRCDPRWCDCGSGIDGGTQR